MTPAHESSELVDMQKRTSSKLALLGVIAVVAFGCHTQLIPNTDVEDTQQNRAVIDFCEQYRKAVERKDIRYLMGIAHPDYYEDGGNVDSSDDLDRAGLEEYLKDRFSQTQSIRYEIRYRRVGEGRNDKLYVDYTYSASYQLPAKEGEQWHRAVEDNRLELVPHQDSYLVLSGM